MGVIDFIKDIIRPGNGVDYPKQGDMVTVHYHGYLYDPTRSWNRGRRYVNKGQSNWSTILRPTADILTRPLQIRQ